MKAFFLGGGNMGAAIVGGLVAKGFAAGDITVADPSAPAREQLARAYGVRAIAPPGSWPEADVAVLAVKPQQMRDAARALGKPPASLLVVSIAAGIRVADLARWLGGHTAIVRAMPNTPALVRCGITGLFAPGEVGPEARERAATLLGAVGDTVWLDRESDLDAVTAISGSGPAYVFYLMESLEAAGREMGLAPGPARKLALQTFVGAATLAQLRGEDPAVLRAQVTSPGGTTERALAEMDRVGLKSAFIAAVKAARARSAELGDAFGED